MQLEVNNTAAINLTAKLEELHRSAFPSAVRNTLNQLAFNHIQQIPTSAQKKFPNTRNKTFIKSMTQVVKATGFDVSKMKAISGINQSKIKGNFKNRIGQNLQSEEEGTTVTNTKILPLDNARLGRSLNGKVRRGMFKNDISFYDATDSFKRKPKSGSGSKKAAFIRAMHATLKAGKKQMLIRGSKGRLTGFIYDINYSSNLKSKSTKIKASLVYGLRPKRTHTSERYAFVEDARKNVLKDIQKIYNDNAEFQFKKHLK